MALAFEKRQNRDAVATFVGIVVVLTVLLVVSTVLSFRVHTNCGSHRKY